jgi:hypothetical protein
MNDKRKIKQKRKRGAFQGHLDFISPLSPEDCIEHLKAGRTPFSTLDLGIETDGDHFQVLPCDRSYQRHLMRNERNPIRTYESVMSNQFRSTTGFWFEGQFEPHEAGTRVYGRVVRNSVLFKLGVFALVMVWLAAQLTIASDWLSGSADFSEVMPGLTIGSAVLLISMIPILLYRNFRQRQTRTLLEWIDERLNVRRDKR